MRGWQTTRLYEGVQEVSIEKNGSRSLTTQYFMAQNSPSRAFCQHKKQVIKTRGGGVWPGRGREGRPYMNLGMLQWWLDWLGLFRFSAIIMTQTPLQGDESRCRMRDSFEFGAWYIEKSNNIFCCEITYKISVSRNHIYLYRNTSMYLYLHMIHIYIPWHIKNTM